MKKKMILPLLICFAALLQNNAWSQQSSESQTLFGNGAPLSLKDIGFFVAPAFGLTQMDGDAAALFHVRGGLSLGKTLSFGGFYNVSLNEIYPITETLPNVYMDYWAAGGFAEATILSNRLLHVSLPLYFGYGEVEMDNEIGEARLGESNFLLVEPSALLELNLHKNVRFNLGAGYRIVSEMNYRNFNQSDISGLTGYLGFKFGLFP
jgi:hypothetical protein